MEQIIKKEETNKQTEMAVKSVFTLNKNMLSIACSVTFNACVHIFSLPVGHKMKIPINHELANVYSRENNFELFVLVIDTQGGYVEASN